MISKLPATPAQHLRQIAMMGLLFATTTALGCTESPRSGESVEPAQPSRASVAPKRQSSCGPELADLDPWLAALAMDGDAGWFASVGFEGTPLDAPAEHIPLATLFRVHTDHIAHNLDGQRWVDDFSELQTKRDELVSMLRVQLATKLKRSAKDPDRPVRPPLLQVDRRAPFGATASLVQLLYDTGYREIRFVFDATSRAQPPANTKLLASLLPLVDRNLSYRGTFDGPLLSGFELDTMFSACPEVRDELRHPAPNTFQVSAERLTHSLTPLLTQCGCQIDIEALKGLIWIWMGRADAEPKTAIALRLSDDEVGDTQIRASAETPFGEVAQRISEVERKTVRLSVGGQLAD